MDNKLFLNTLPFFTPNDIDLFTSKENDINKYSENVIFIVNLINKFNVKNIDFLACDSLHYSKWNIYYQILNKFTQCIVGASNDRTGNLQYGGNWTMENTNENIKNTYFNGNIDNYSELLIASSIIAPSSTLNYYSRQLHTINIKSKRKINLTNFEFTFYGGIHTSPNATKNYTLYYRKMNTNSWYPTINVNNLNIDLEPNIMYELLLIFEYNFHVVFTAQNKSYDLITSDNNVELYTGLSGLPPINIISPILYKTMLPETAYSYIQNVPTNNFYSIRYKLNYTYKLIPSLSDFNLPTRSFNKKIKLLPPKSNSDGTFTYTSSNKYMPIVNKNELKIILPRTTVITATQAETNDYYSAQISKTLYTSDICFPAGTPIQTDQGEILIEQIDSNIHTINNKKIIGLTKICSIDDFLVCFEKDSLEKNVPSKQTIISKHHGIYYNGKFLEAQYFLPQAPAVKKFDNVHKIKCNGQILYNIIAEHDRVMVNNLECETLNPNNETLKLYMDK